MACLDLIFSDPMFTVDSAEAGLALVLTPIHADGVFTARGIPVSAVQFLQETLDKGDLVTPFLADAKLRYPGLHLCRR